MLKHLSLLGLVLVILGCQNPPAGESEKTGGKELPLDWAAISATLLERMDLQAGENVLLAGVSGDFDPLIPLLEDGIVKADANYLGAIAVEGEAPESWTTEFTQQAVGRSREELRSYFSDLDLGVMLPGADPSHAPYGALQDILKEGSRRTIHFHWSGAYHLDGTEKAIDSTVHEFYEKALLETDYEELAAVQREFEEAMRGLTIQVTTPAGTNLLFQIGDRPVTRQDGDASAERARQGQNLIDREVELPAGAIRVAPLEETVSGTIAFPDGQWNGQPVKGLVMTFEQGKVTDFQAEEGREHVQAELDEAGEAGRSFREFALGFNPLLSIEAAGGDWIPYYGYGAGVVRLSLGNNTELGGNVGGGYVRWNFFTDASVAVGDWPWVREGKLLE